MIHPSDRILRRPIVPWQDSLVNALVEATSQWPIDFDTAIFTLNQLALIQAYQGNMDGALLICEAQIQFWRRVSATPGNDGYITAVLQPWINILRLKRWNNQLSLSESLWMELAPPCRSRRGSLQKIYNIKLSYEELEKTKCEIYPPQLLDMLYWREFGHILLGATDGKRLERHLQNGLLAAPGEFIRLSLFEMLLIYQAKIGYMGKSLEILQRIRINPTGPYALQFKALEMYFSERLYLDGSANRTGRVIAEKLFEDCLNGNAADAMLIFDISRIFQDLAMPHYEIPLLYKALEAVQRDFDEILNFNIRFRLNALLDKCPEDFHKTFANSSYAIIRRQIGLAPKIDAGSLTLVKAIQALADLKFSACTILLKKCCVF
jgi:hypothetical protein